MNRPGSSSWSTGSTASAAIQASTAQPWCVRRRSCLGLRFTDDGTIADLNSAWRQKTGPTDVLSFAALDDAGNWMEGPSIELGDIVVSLETARRQAQEQGHSLQRELRWLVSHGLLHLLGWDLSLIHI